ncbi:MAG TPA: hypothetical protein VGO73_00970 [Pyrinomonadaceae bacterium]|nr:hypothetical protein [Pyrinomonadaceae bacterium]
MRSNSLTLRIALVCGVLLLSLSATSAQKNKSRKHQTTEAQTPKTATPCLCPCPAPPPSSLAGSYTLDDPGATERVKAAIETAVKGLSVLTKSTVRTGLEKTNLPPPNRLSISFKCAEVSITTDIAGEVKTSTDGTQRDWTRGKDNYKVSTIWDQDKLVRTFKGSEAERVNVYSLGEGGATLTMQVTVIRKAIFGGFKLAYNLVYRRAR